MTVIRCPRCGRAADGVECLACGYLWSAAPAPAPAPVTGLADNLDVSAPARATPPPGAPAPAPIAMPPPPVTFGGAPAPAPAPPPRASAAPPLPSRAAPSAVAAAPRPPLPTAPTATPTPTPTTNPVLRSPSPTSGPALDAAVTSPAASSGGGLAAWVVGAVPPGGVIERFLRSPFAFVASGGAAFVVVLGFGSLLLFGGADPELDRIDSGKAGAVIDELLAVPVAARTPRQFLLLGHAYARNGATPQALDAYREAAKRGGADRRALDYTLAALDHPFAKHPVEVLVEWKSEDVGERLVELTEAEGWHLRHNALKVLQERGEATPAITERVAIVDVRHGPDCDRRREGLARLEAIGKGEAALDAIQSLRDNYKENFCIPLTELDRAQISVEKRR